MAQIHSTTNGFVVNGKTYRVESWYYPSVDETDHEVWDDDRLVVTLTFNGHPDLSDVDNWIDGRESDPLFVVKPD